METDVAALDHLVGNKGPLVLGEVHGTREIPALVSSVIDRAVAAGRPVRLCLELPPIALPLELRARLAGTRGVRWGVDAPEWTSARPPWAGWWQRLHDGRSSRAMAELVHHMKVLGARHDVQCVPLQNDQFDDADIVLSEQTMADQLIDTARRAPDALVLALVGNGHSWVDSTDSPYSGPPMAALASTALPNLRSLRITTSGGSAWLMTDSARPPGPTSIPADPWHDCPPGIHWWTDVTDHHHGIWVIGAVTTSHPASPT